MIRSMTGFARSETDSPLGRLLWELRTVNHRYLETQIRLPEALRGIEAEARLLIARAARRGKLDATLTLRVETAARRPAALDVECATEVIGHARHIETLIGSAGAIDPIDILRWPGVLREEQPAPEELQPLALAGLARALDELGASRDREGTRLQELLDSRCEEILGHVAAVRQRLPEVLGAIRARLEDRVRGLATPLEPGRLEQELVLIAQKLDVSEELDRLGSHVAEFRAAMRREGEAAGRRLDFLLQEFNREANTLASKSADAETTRRAVDLKVLIEQLREQVQNVE
jgi:uncharacterized protein (TIGR00255 family)